MTSTQEYNDQVEVKPEIKYADSDLLKALKNYDLEPKESIKRKIDYFYSPYGAINQQQKYMKFDEKAEESKHIQYDQKHKPLD